MSILSPDLLFEQADRLILAPPAGPPRQVDLRRAVSAAYYALFHCIMSALADEFVGKAHRSLPRYRLVYRSIDHRALRELCGSIAKPTPPQKLIPFIPEGGFDRSMIVFATAVTDLQEQRHRADYDPRARYRTTDVATVIETGRSGMRRFEHAKESQRKAFLTLLLCPPR